MKTLYNIVLIFLIGFFSSTYLFVMSPINYKDTIVIDEPEQKVKLTLALEGENTLINPKNIVVQHLSNLEMEISNLPNEIFSADIYRGDELVKSNITNLEDTTISIKDSSYIISSDNPLKTTINLSQEKLDLKDGKYKIVLKSNIISESDTNSIDIFVEYDTSFTYYEATNTLPNREKMGLTLYFSDNEANVLIPVTRFVVKEMSLNKQVIHELQKGPVDTTLSKTIDEVNYCIYKDNTIFIDLAAGNEFYNSGSTAGSMAYNSFVKSMFSINKYLQVDKIKFTVDRYASEDYFHGMSVKDPVVRSNNPKLYFGYKVDDRVYLYEHEVLDIDVNANIKTISEQMLEYYKSKLPANAKSPIPNDLTLKDAKMENGTLVLDFNDVFKTAFDGDQTKRKFMIDSLVYSFTSINGVKSVRFTSEGNPVDNFIEGKDITGALTAPSYINPEVVQ